jgi:CcmD family protein
MKKLIIAICLMAFAGVASAQDYQSPLRETWRDEIAKDPELKADIEKDLRYAVHRDEAESFTRNHEHAVMAYIAIWVLTAGFVLATFLRQQKLKQEIRSLQFQLSKAIEDDKK